MKTLRAYECQFVYHKCSEARDRNTQPAKYKENTIFALILCEYPTIHCNPVELVYVLSVRLSFH